MVYCFRRLAMFPMTTRILATFYESALKDGCLPLVALFPERTDCCVLYGAMVRRSVVDAGEGFWPSGRPKLLWAALLLTDRVGKGESAMQQARRRLLVALAVALGVVGLVGSASALTLRLEFAGGATTLNTTPGTVHAVFLLADLSNDFSGQNGISASVQFGSGLTPTFCAEAPGPQSAGGAMWAPLTPNCGAGDPGDGGIGGIHPPGIVEAIWQAAGVGAGNFGTLHLGTIIFDALTEGIHTITPFFAPEFDGWIDANSGFHEIANFESATVNVPEPNASHLLAGGCLTLAILARFGGRLN
jgi:hypothetical protein